MNQHRALLIKYLKPMWPKVTWLAVLILAGSGLQLANPLIIRYFIDTALGSQDTQPMLIAALAFLGISVLTQLIGVAAVYVGEDVGWRATNQLRADLTRHCLRLDMSFHNAHTPGEMIERIDGDILNLANFFSRFVVNILGNLLLLIGILLVLAFVDWRITLTLFLYVAVGLVGLVLLRQVAVPAWRAARQASADLFGFLEEQLVDTEDIVSSGATAYVMHNLFKFNKASLDKELQSATATTLIVVLWVGLYVVGQALAFALGYYLLEAGLITIGAVYLIIYFTYLVLTRLSEVADQIQDLQRAGASIGRVEALLAEETRIKSVPVPAALASGPLSVMFDQVTFGYNQAEPVLQNISFQLQAGQTLGLLGRTGSGKTTITRLLFRLYDPDQGAIRLATSRERLNSRAGCDLRELALDKLRARIGLVTQNVQLFNASVRDNVTFFDQSIPDGKVIQAIMELGLEDWYQALPQGLDTQLETGGSNLSAGEGQLLAFARVFLRNPDLVILDEASSRLDPLTEKRIERAVDKLLQNRTGIIVAHRLATVERVDHILILEGGQIEEFGEYQALASDPTSQLHHLLQTGMAEVLA